MKRWMLAATLAFANLSRGASTTVTFKSQEVWTSSRWYLVGQLVGANIEWLSGGTSKIKFGPQKCNGPKASEVANASLVNMGSEVMHEKSWIAVQVDPAKKSDTLNFTFADGCKAQVPLAWAVTSASTSQTTPYLFLKPLGNIYMGHQFDVVVPKGSKSADILIDLVGGGSSVALGNPAAGSKSKLISAPIVEARGEWSPDGWGGFGFELHMLQGLSSFGGVTGQDILISEWHAGPYYQQVFSVGQSLALRFHVDFFQHLVDQGTGSLSVGTFEADHRGLNVGVSLAQYFLRRWHVQARGDYGYPSRISGQGVDQSFLRLHGRVGYLVTDSVTLLVEGAYRSFGYVGHNSTTATSAAAGFRLEL